MDEYTKFMDEMGKHVIGKKDVIEKLFIALIAEGHVLLEGVPGIAKTHIANTMARCLSLEFKRVQFTADLLPADILGTLVYSNGSFTFKKGPIFTNILLADEINRAPPKTQSALLEAMQERQVSIDVETYKLEEPFIVIATQNPIEMEGTYPLPEAQLDRFIFKLLLTYPTKEEEKGIVRYKEKMDRVNRVLTKKEILRLREKAKEVSVSDEVVDYIVNIVEATRKKEELLYGASPRASISLMRAAKVKALIEDRDYVIPDDVKGLAKDVLRHRVILKPEYIGEKSEDEVIDEVLESVSVPK